jgi:hypothetical protein
MSPPLPAGASGGVGGVGGLLLLPLPPPLPLRDEARVCTRSAVHDPLSGEE